MSNLIHRTKLCNSKSARDISSDHPSHTWVSMSFTRFQQYWSTAFPYLPKLLWFCVTVNGVTMCHLTRSSRFRLLEASPGQSQHDLRMWDSPNSIKCHKPTIWGWFIHVYIYVYIYICFSNTPWWMVYGCLWHPHPRPLAAMLADRRCFATWDEPVAYPEKWRNGDPTCSIETICHSSCFQWKLWKHMETKEQHSAAENGASSDCCCNVLVLSLSRLASLPIGSRKLKQAQN